MRENKKEKDRLIGKDRKIERVMEMERQRFRVTEKLRKTRRKRVKISRRQAYITSCIL